MTPLQFHQTTVLFCAFLSLAGHLHGQEELKKERYIESNWGIALIDSDLFPFPGTSILIGKRSYFSEHGFLDTQIGLAFPSVLTAKIGVGQTGSNGGHFSAGLRLFPTHAYIQTGIPSKRCNRDLSPKKMRRLERRGKSAADIKCSEWAFSLEVSPLLVSGSLPPISEDLEVFSLYSYAMITAGRRWMF